jgi:hypothetical protein
MANTPFAVLADVTATIEWTLTEDEERLAQGALESLSDDARFYGRPWFNQGDAPRQVHNLVLKATRRYLRNPDGFTLSRAGDEATQWSDQGSAAGEAGFTPDEIKILRDLGGQRDSLRTAESVAWGPIRTGPVGLVPVEGGGKPFPLYNDDDGPW